MTQNLQVVYAFLILSFFIHAPARAAAVQSPFPLFIFEKNENPQNILVTHADLDGNCRFQGRLFDFYWLIDGVIPKSAHSLIKSGIRRRLDLVAQTERHLKMEVRGLVEFDRKVESASLEFFAEPKGESCEVHTIAHLKLIDQEMESIRLSRVFSESVKTWKPPFRKIESVTLTGVNVADGTPVVRIIKKTKI